MEQVQLLEGHFNAVPVTVTVAETAAQSENDSNVDGDVGLESGAGNGSWLEGDGERQRIAEMVKASPPLARRVKVSQRTTGPVDAWLHSFRRYLGCINTHYTNTRERHQCGVSKHTTDPVDAWLDSHPVETWIHQYEVNHKQERAINTWTRGLDECPT